MAFILAQLIEPLIKFLMKRLKMRRKVSAIIIFVISLSIIIGIIVGGIINLVSEAANLLGNINFYFNKIYQNAQVVLSRLNFNQIKISNELNGILQNATEGLINTASIWVKNVLSNFLNAVGSLPQIGLCIAITLLALYFMCTDKIYMLDQIEHHLPEKWVKHLTKHIKSLTKTLGCYLKAELTLVLISFVISLVGLYIFKIVGMKVTYPLIAAIGIAVVDALPIFGSGTVMVPWAIISACNGDITLGISILVLWIVMSVVRQVIEPKIVSNHIGIHPIFTLIAMYTRF